MVCKVFIDANIIVHYIILNKMKELDKDSKEYRSIKPSYELMDKLLKETIEDFKFYTSNLAFTETIHALYDEYKCRRMRKEGVPLSSWTRIKPQFILDEEDLKELTAEITMVAEKCIGKITLIPEKYHFEMVTDFMLNKEIATQDSILLSTAISNNCDFFVTQDRELREKRINKINIISPETMKAKLKHYPLLCVI